MWFWYALASAIIGAVTIILNKKILRNVRTSILTWSLFAFPIPILIYLSFKDGMLAVNQWFFLGAIVSGLIFAFAKMFSTRAIKQGLLSQLFPLSAFSSLFSYIFALLFLKEHVRFLPLMGLLTILVGAYVLNADQVARSIFKPFVLLFSERSARMYVFAMFLASTSSVFDKIGLLNVTPSNPALVLLSENIIITVLLTGYLERSDKLWFGEVKKHFWELGINSILYLALVLFVFQGFIGAPIALVLGVKKVEILFVLLLGWLFFKDRPTRHTWIAALFMLAGIVLIKF